MLFLPLFFTILLGCEKSEPEQEPAPENIMDLIPICKPDKEVKAVEDVTAMVIFNPWAEKFVIRKGIDGTYDSVDVGLLCELPEEYQEHGLRIIFSGVYYDIEEDLRKQMGWRIPGETYYILKLKSIALDTVPPEEGS